MSILLLSVCDHPYHDRFLFGVIASVISACDNLLFSGMLRHPFFCYNSYVLMCDSAQAFAKRQESGISHFFCYNNIVPRLHGVLPQKNTKRKVAIRIRYFFSFIYFLIIRLRVPCTFV